jgi:hypothetical protein
MNDEVTSFLLGMRIEMGSRAQQEAHKSRDAKCEQSQLWSAREVKIRELRLCFRDR